MLRKISFIVLVILGSMKLPAQQRTINLTSVMPSQNILRVNKAAIGKEYRKSHSGDIPENSLIVENGINIGTKHVSTYHVVDAWRGNPEGHVSMRVRNRTETGWAGFAAVNDDWDTFYFGKSGSDRSEIYGIDSRDGYIFNQSGAFRIVQDPQGAGAFSALTINPEGNVGIGPVGAIYSDLTVAVEEDEIAEIRLGRDYASGRDAILRKATDDSPYNFDIVAGANESHSNSPIRFFTGDHSDYERMRINRDGNVGIGATATSARLYVEASSDENQYSAKIVNPRNHSSAHGLKIKGESTSNNTSLLDVRSGNSSRFYVAGDGRVGIGTDSPGGWVGLEIDRSNMGYAGALRLHGHCTSTGDLSSVRLGSSNYEGPGWAFVHHNAGNKLFLNYMTGSNVQSHIMEINKNGNIKVNGNIQENQGSSDIRLKKNVENIEDALSKILNLDGIAFEWNTEKYPERNFRQGIKYSLSAQDVEEVIPELVSTDDDGYKRLDTQGIIPFLIDSISEQQEMIEELKKQMSLMKSRLD